MEKDNKLVPCPACGHLVSKETADKCPNCGQELISDRKKGELIVSSIGLVILLAILWKTGMLAEFWRFVKLMVKPIL